MFETMPNLQISNDAKAFAEKHIDALSNSDCFIASSLFFQQPLSVKADRQGAKLIFNEGWMYAKGLREGDAFKYLQFEKFKEMKQTITFGDGFEITSTSKIEEYLIAKSNDFGVIVFLHGVRTFQQQMKNKHAN